jgi:AhpD family alkylhydroperoxidase
MARIAMLPLDGPEASDGYLVNQDLYRIMRRRPEAAQGLVDLVAVILETGTLPKRLLELVRLRIAFHNQCRSCMAVRFGAAAADGLDDELVCSLEQPQEAPDLSDAEKAALRFADLLATNHLAIDDAVYDDLRQYFDEGELVELGLHCALGVGTGRLAATWQVTDHVPDHLKADGVVGPWDGEQFIVGGPAADRCLDG